MLIWNYNILTVKGPEEKIDWFYKRFHKYGFEGFYPTPEELMNEPAPQKNKEKEQKFMKKYGAPDWRKWRLNNWGTKYNVDDAYVKLNEGVVEATFETAWSPPIEFFQKLHQDNPELEIELWFEESGTEFFGLLRCKDGECRDNDYEWRQRYNDGWWLYKQYINKDGEFDMLYENLSEYNKLEEDLIVLSKHYNKIKNNDDKVAKLFEVMSLMDVDEVKDFAKQIKGELE